MKAVNVYILAEPVLLEAQVDMREVVAGDSFTQFFVEADLGELVFSETEVEELLLQRSRCAILFVDQCIMWWQRIQPINSFSETLPETMGLSVLNGLVGYA